MDYTLLGNSGLKVSRIALGGMSFGSGTPMAWILDEDAAQPIFRQAVDLGITFWDTANVYGMGTSEEIIGRAITKYTSREQTVLATKQFWPMNDGPGGSGLSRKAITEQTEASLRRLGTDYIDLMQIHCFDPNVPAAETMEALPDLVKSGKVRYIGASSMWAWQFSKMQSTAELHGWTKFISVQDQYSLTQREEEREMFGLLADQGVGSIPWSRSMVGSTPARGVRRAPSEPSQARRQTCSATRSTSTATRPSSTPPRRSPLTAGCRWRRSRSRGCCVIRSWPLLSPEPPSHTTSPTQRRRWKSRSPTTKFAPWKSRTSPARPLTSTEPTNVQLS